MLSLIPSYSDICSKVCRMVHFKGVHVITCTFPMDEVLSYKPGGKAKENVQLLENYLAVWLEGE